MCKSGCDTGSGVGFNRQWYLSIFLVSRGVQKKLMGEGSNCHVDNVMSFDTWYFYLFFSKTLKKIKKLKKNKKNYILTRDTLTNGVSQILSQMDLIETLFKS